MFNNVVDRKETFFGHQKNSIFQSPKNRIFAKGLTHAFGQRMQFFFFICFPSLKISVEIIFTDFVKKN